MAKNKRALEVTAANEDESTPSVPAEEPQQRLAPSYELPQHSRQAAFSLLYLFVFSCMMFSLPFGAFYGVRHLLDIYFTVTAFQTTVYSVLATVVTVNLIIVGYAVVAYNETEYDDQGNVIDQSRFQQAAVAPSIASQVAKSTKPNNKKNKQKLI